MISFMKSWCEGIIVAVMVSIIIELMIPEGNNKKYVKVVIGIYILFVIISPILDKINTNYTLEKFLKIDTIEVSTNVNNNIKQVYIDGIEETIKNELIDLGYLIKNVNIKVDNNYENIEKIEIELFSQNIKSNEIMIEQIKISENQINEKEDMNLKKIISEKYQILVDNIYIYQN